MNPVIEFLQQRQSTPAGQLTYPAPEKSILEHCFKAAQSAPDHGGLLPWRFEVVAENRLQQLADKLEQALLERDPKASPSMCQRERERALRAPMVIIAIARIDPKQARVPAIEQQLAAGCAALQFMQAVQSCGFGAIWLSGARIYHPSLTRRLLRSDHEQIIGLINVGTPAKPWVQKMRSTCPVTYW